MKDFDNLIRKRLSVVALFGVLSVVAFNILRIAMLDYTKINFSFAIVVFLEYLLTYLLCKYTKAPIKNMSGLFLFIFIQVIFHGLFIEPIPGYGVFVCSGIMFTVIYLQSVIKFNLISTFLIALFIISNEMGYTHNPKTVYLITIFAAIAIMALCSILMAQRLSLAKQIFDQTINQKKYNKSNLSNDDMQSISNEISSYFEEKEDHLNPDFKARNLASTLEIPLYKLSQVLNIGMGISFSDFLNKHRIDEVKRRLIDQKYNNENIINIAFDCGFATKSSFNSNFKEQTGMTPKDYKMKYQEK